ncbi:M23 family metallopeptidase [Myxococcus sp. RHSTA-1-4]|uniref:M23 family metallopeptidase n=1 Tax=Myxococcus sp. RHSTA-1-4 TaxID=2874601 RepID=UPI001CC18C3D|nr:M23 family metallopeptidase [Myxococcus sp. RHSTA-1-4]MBZ4418013.1 M23 family metallopeptidase [Myxococcus sp. RHSTA-1-4]
MNTYGTVASALLILLMVYAGVMFGVSFAGLTGDGPMVPTAVVALVAWGVFILLLLHGLRRALAVRRGDDNLFGATLFWTNTLSLAGALLSIVTAFAFGFGAFASCGPVWLAGLYHWGGLVGSALCFVAWFVAPVLARGGGRNVMLHGWKTLAVTGAVVYGLWGVVWLVAWLMLRGSIDSAAYPTANSSPYQLPYPDGERSWIIQGNNSSFNHKDDEEHAWDFRRQCGTPVLAARGGTVLKVQDDFEGNGKKKPNNSIQVRHDDGTVAKYLHIRTDSAKVAEGDDVKQGQPLAEVGNVGNSLTGHIHFVVEKGGDSIPVTFQDVGEDKGIPRTFERYASAK